MIRPLPEHVRTLIAAGEVIARPLDVVRELIDNALDAGASRLELEVSGGGLKKVALRDNGKGIAAEELSLAPLRHTTSKIHDAKDIERIDTLGFRGEALWSIAQAGKLHILTRPQEQLGATELFAFLDRVSTMPARAAAGSKITLTDLFEHYPARLRTQAPTASEYREISQLLGRYVLHHPELAVKGTFDGEVRFNHAPSDTKGAIATVFGALSANRMLDVHSAYLQGVITRPELTRPRKDRMLFAVNGRPVDVPEDVYKAVLKAYGEMLPGGQFPTCVLNLNLPPENINPNVHPSKQTVAFANLADVCKLIEDAIGQALSQHPLSKTLPISAASQVEQSQFGRLPTFIALGVYRELYLLCESDKDLWLIDVHAMHERIWYERLQKAFAADPPLELPSPEMVQLSTEQQAVLFEQLGVLGRWGFVFEPFGANLVRIRSIPSTLSGLSIPNILDVVLQTALNAQNPEREVLAKLACHPALKAGSVTLANASELLSEWQQCANPWVCPHGRPTTLKLQERDIAHAFGRRSARDTA